MSGLRSTYADLHTGEHGYREIFPVYGQLGSMTAPAAAAFAEDVKIEGTDYYPIPTAEVPVTNPHRDDPMLKRPALCGLQRLLSR